MIGQVVLLTTPSNTQCFQTDRLCAGYGKKTNKVQKMYFNLSIFTWSQYTQINQINVEMLSLFFKNKKLIYFKFGWQKNSLITMSNKWVIGLPSSSAE